MCPECPLVIRTHTPLYMQINMYALLLYASPTMREGSVVNVKRQREGEIGHEGVEQNNGKIRF